VPLWFVTCRRRPFHVGKQRFREGLLGHTAQKFGIPLCCVNQVGAKDDLIFDGPSAAWNAEGQLISRAQAFKNDVCVIDPFEDSGSIAAHDFEVEAEIWKALVLAIRDFWAGEGVRVRDAAGLMAIVGIPKASTILAPSCLNCEPEILWRPS
jgi:hypothetical protein